MSSKLVDQWEARVEKIDLIIRPFAEAPVDFNKLDELFASPPKPLDEAGCRSDCESLVSEIVNHYLKLDGGQQVRVQKLFVDYSSFGWVASLPKSPCSEVEIERQVILFMIRDQSPDPRDAIMELEALVVSAEKVGLDIKKIIKKLSGYANDQEKWGFPSTRSLLESRC